MNVVIAVKDNDTQVYRCDEGFRYGQESKSESEESKSITDVLTGQGYRCATLEAKNPSILFE